MSKRPGRNDPCQCGSGKKYKRCCLPGDEAAARERARPQGLFADDLLPGDADFDEDDNFEESFESEEDLLELDVRTIISVCYTRGFVEGSADLAAGRDLHVTEWTAPRIPQEVLEIIERESLGALEGEWGDPKAGDPIQVDVIDVETDADIICIEVFNRAILLAQADAGEAPRIHGVCEVLEAASQQGIDRSADSGEEARAATVTRRARAAPAQAVDLSGILREHRRQGRTCALCGEAISRGAARKHAARCAPTYDQQEGTTQQLMHVRAVAPGLPAYWLDVEVRADARLDALDSFLRRVWLECCGHMSAFTIGAVRYFSGGYDFSFGRTFSALGGRRSVERSMSTRLSDALPQIGERFEYEYDFGSTTRLELSVVGERSGRIGRGPARLLARNIPPVWPCAFCGQPASIVCAYCYQAGPDAFVCKYHRRQHGCDEDEGLMPLANSPRTGICGYTGDS